MGFGGSARSWTLMTLETVAIVSFGDDAAGASGATTESGVHAAVAKARTAAWKRLRAVMVIGPPIRRSRVVDAPTLAARRHSAASECRYRQ
jgi:hypothetical protein